FVPSVDRLCARAARYQPLGVEDREPLIGRKVIRSRGTASRWISCAIQYRQCRIIEVVPKERKQGFRVRVCVVCAGCCGADRLAVQGEPAGRDRRKQPPPDASRFW